MRSLLTIFLAIGAFTAAAQEQQELRKTAKGDFFFSGTLGTAHAVQSTATGTQIDYLSSLDDHCIRLQPVQLTYMITERLSVGAGFSVYFPPNRTEREQKAIDVAAQGSPGRFEHYDLQPGPANGKGYLNFVISADAGYRIEFGKWATSINAGIGLFTIENRSLEFKLKEIGTHRIDLLQISPDSRFETLPMVEAGIGIYRRIFKHFEIGILCRYTHFRSERTFTQERTELLAEQTEIREFTQKINAGYISAETGLRINISTFLE